MSKTAFIFPGQGVQKAGMGKDFYEIVKWQDTFTIWQRKHCSLI